MVFSASPVPRRVYPSVWHDRGGIWPTGSVEEKWAQETGPTVLVSHGRLSNTAITRVRGRLWEGGRMREEEFYTVSLPWLRTCSRSPQMTNQILVTSAWTSKIRREDHRDIMHSQTGYQCNCGFVLEWCVSNRDHSTVVLCFSQAWRMEEGMTLSPQRPHVGIRDQSCST